MKRLDALLQELFEPRGLLSLIRTPRLRLDVLRELVERGDPAAIPHLAPIMSSRSEEDARAVAEAIGSLLLRAGPEDLVRLDEAMRRSWLCDAPFGPEWYGLTAEEVARWAEREGAGPSLAALASFHFNGYVREEAVTRLAAVGDGSELPFLLLRLNDWVPQIRETARTAVLARMTEPYATTLAENLVLVIRLGRAGRADHSEILRAAFALLLRPATRAALLRALESPVTEVRRVVFRALTSEPRAELADLLRVTLRSFDPAIRLASARLAASVLSDAELRPLADALAASTSGAMRREALRIEVARFPNQAREKLLAALLDPSPAVAEEARFNLRGEGLDFAALYRGAMETSNTKQLVAAMTGLSVTGSAADGERIAAFLSDPRPRVRRTAIRSLARLGLSPHVDAVFARLTDEAPGVSAQARTALLPHADEVRAEAFLGLLDDGAAPQYARLNAVALLAALSKWESIASLVRASANADADVAAAARERVTRWNADYNRRGGVPSDRQRAALEAALVQSEDALPRDLTAVLRFTLRTVGGG
jgi:HEAT repeat protein